ncbi:hypothetical protein Tsubulata_009203 [Turnera subulata]|uniref:Armadillo repeat-containing protein 6 n=1 Tax=Turnera subulata TaxID=218843 RepID=A0A9Q0FMR8_9ROSI|nr:hypothetical protein Tsubulata_009203 [Turnera subulata]
MAPPANNSAAAGGRKISQAAFDDLVKENIEDLGMDPAEALEDAIQTLTLQGVDLSAISTCLPGEANPLLQCLDRLKQAVASTSHTLDAEAENSLDTLSDLLSADRSKTAAIAVENGAVDLVLRACSTASSSSPRALNTLGLLLHDMQSTEAFRSCNGPRVLVSILKDGTENVEVLKSAFSVVAAASTGNEVVKAEFMELKIDEIILQVLGRHGGKGGGGCVLSVYDAIVALLTPDDPRVVASEVYGYARRFAKIGIATALVESLHGGLAADGLVSATIALKAVAVNDSICKSIAESGGIDVMLQCIDDSGEQGNKIVARTCCSLLSKLAGSDSNKTAIVEKGGLKKLIQLSNRFSDDPSVLQEVMSIIRVICLRSPDNAALAIEAGAGELAIQAMENFPAAPQLQKNSCLMIRNLVVRNPENRQV